MQDFSFCEMPSENELDVKNPIYDLLIREEDLHPAARQMQEDITHIHSKVNSLEDNHPAREALQDQVNTVMKDSFNVEHGLDRIALATGYLSGEDLTNYGALMVGGFGSAVSVPLAVSAVAAGPVGLLLFAAPMLGASGLLVYEGLEDSLEEAQHVRSLVNDYLDMASKVHDVREDFDDTWVGLVGDEGGDLEPDDYPEGR